MNKIWTLIGVLLLTACTYSNKVEKQSYLDQKLKCRQHGEEKYENKNWGDGSSNMYNFYYSPKLDSCIVETQLTAIGGITYVLELSDMLEGGRIQGYFYCGNSDDCKKSCTEDNCTEKGLAKYQQKKMELLAP